MFNLAWNSHVIVLSPPVLSVECVCVSVFAFGTSHFNSSLRLKSLHHSLLAVYWVLCCGLLCDRNSGIYLKKTFKRYSADFLKMLYISQSRSTGWTGLFFFFLKTMITEKKAGWKKGNCGNRSTSVILSEHKTDRPCRWPILSFFMDQLSSYDKERTEHAPSATWRKKHGFYFSAATVAEEAMTH